MIIIIVIVIQTEKGMTLHSALGGLGINSRVLSFLAPYMEDLQLNFSEFPHRSYRRWQGEGEFAEQLTPPAGKVWLAGGGHPILISDLYLFDSPLEAACFAHCFNSCLARPDQVALAALGLCPQAASFRQLLTRYPNARIHTVFPRDIPGMIADCLVALWSNNLEGKFSFLADRLVFRGTQTNYEFYEHDFSLNKFEKWLRLHSGVRAHKPKGGFNSFFQLLKAHQSQAPGK